MNGTDLHLLTGAYAADALSEEERLLFERHLAVCPTCAQEAAELVSTVSRLAAASAEPAPREVRDRVLREVTTIRQERLGGAGAPSPPVRRAWYAQPLGIAASFLLVLCLALAAVAVYGEQRADRAEQLAARIAAVATHPDRVSLEQPVRTGGTVHVVAAEGDAVFRAQDLRRLPEGRAYQLWVMDDSGARSVGVLGPGISPDVEHFVDDVGAGDTLGLTVEPAAGSERPTSDPVVLMTMG